MADARCLGVSAITTWASSMVTRGRPEPFDQALVQLPGVARDSQRCRRRFV
jgi:hypothetical protein